MHILYICQYFPPEMGAPAARAYEFSRRWVQMGHRVSVVCGIPNHPTGEVYPGYDRSLRSHEVVEGIDVYRTWVYVTANSGMKRRSLNYLSFGLSSVFSSLLVRDVDVCVATTPQFFSGLSGAAVRRLKGIPLVLEVRDLWPDSIEAMEINTGKALLRMLRRIERYMYHAAKRIVVVSPAFRKHIESKDIEAESIDVIPNGVNTALFSPGKPERRHFGGKLAGKFLVGYFGTHGLAHGLETVLEAARLLRDDDGVHFIFVGEGAKKTQLKSLARDVRNVSFLDRRPREEIAEMLNEIDVGLVVLRKLDLFKTVIPSKMFEIMGAGKPMILGVRGQAQSILEEAEAGIAVEPENPEALVAAIRRLRGDGAFREQCGINASKYVRNNYDLEVLAKRYSETLQQVCAEQS